LTNTKAIWKKRMSQYPTHHIQSSAVAAVHRYPKDKQ